MIRTLDHLSLLGMAIGIALMLQPFFAGGLRAGFFLTLLATLVQIVVGRMRSEGRVS
jgi:hypothetical protein